MNLSIEEMLADLQSALETFRDNPTDTTFDMVLKETFRIDRVVEDCFCEDEE